MEPGDFDVLIVGAGLSGIAAAYHLQTSCPTKRFVILEGRGRLGGTWDLFRYPGIRSDSDMYTLGYPFRPWQGDRAIADGASILAYLRETAEAYGIDRKIRFGQRVESASWSSELGRWTVGVRDVASGARRELTCRFLFACAGYYDYDEGYTPELPGRERYLGRIVHPQKWTPDIDYDGKRVVVIGSGATAVTLVPALAERAAHVTMLQRSPTYIISLPARDTIASWLHARLPPRLAYRITRWKNVVLGLALYQFCRQLPGRARRLLIGQLRKQVGPSIDVDTHFNPAYEPWDQRLCLVPDGDLFRAIRDGRVSVVTDHIESFTERGLRLRSGTELEADLVVTATGLKLKFLGGMALEVDGRRVEPARTLCYKGVMFSGVPNLAAAIGYTNASWTLKADLICEYVCRLLRHMDARGYVECRPELEAPPPEEAPLLGLTSGYIQRAIHLFPKQGTRPPWRVHQNYLRDLVDLRHAPLEDGVLRFFRAPAVQAGAPRQEPAERAQASAAR